MLGKGFSRDNKVGIDRTRSRLLGRDAGHVLISVLARTKIEDSGWILGLGLDISRSQYFGTVATLNSSISFQTNQFIFFFSFFFIN